MKNDKINFEVETNESLANSIRRSVNEISVLAIDEIEVFKNDSPLHDEVIAHRLGLVPLANKNITLRENCKCKDKGCSKCEIKSKLVGKGPCTVYSKDLTGLDVCFDNIPLTILEKGQELELSIDARTGKGVKHSKFIPGLLFYRNLKGFKTGQKAKEISEIFSNCPNKCGGKTKIENNKNYVLDFCDACEDKLDKLDISMEPASKLLFSIESFGQIEAKNILSEAVNVLKKNLQEVLKQLKK
jgi:DNA-directed RNA polymerase subunit D